MRKEFYFVRLPPFERPPVKDYGEKSGRVFSVMARSGREATRNVIVREFRESYRLIFDFLSNLPSYSVSAKGLLDSISPFDELMREAKGNLTDKIYFLAEELGSFFGLKPESMLPYAEEYLATLPNQ